MSKNNGKTEMMNQIKYFVFENMWKNNIIMMKQWKFHKNVKNVEKVGKYRKIPC